MLHAMCILQHYGFLYNLCILGCGQILRTMLDILTRNALGSAETLVSLNGDIEVEQAVYLKDFSEFSILSVNCKIDWKRFAGGVESSDVLDGKVDLGLVVCQFFVYDVGRNSFDNNLKGDKHL